MHKVIGGVLSNTLLWPTIENAELKGYERRGSRIHRCSFKKPRNCVCINILLWPIGIALQLLVNRAYFMHHRCCLRRYWHFKYCHNSNIVLATCDVNRFFSVGKHNEKVKATASQSD
jgi:hypothetical protein